uniref:Uncharacterized protein n=1 Tax=Palpitomonas bilix TaxID=652834 RepID=A0A7S3D908_9EUKA|mmetsp:Transcript_26696/g.68584  ORF Transcript_26696/g.68584 Transcript_26696/m.68584 type:complete len:428 (+) Transcript_26696:309-1592(+)
MERKRGAIKASFEGDSVYVQDALARSAPSVPSKFETVLHPNTSKEKNAFGARTHRFQNMENQQPGPGSYNFGVEGRSNMGPSAESVGKKGFGVGFASKTHRFSDAPPPLFIVPGPGAYGEKGFFQLRTESDYGKGGYSRIFAPKMGMPRVQNKVTVPGPGHYETAKAAPSEFHGERESHPAMTAPKAAQSVFMSSSDRVLEDKSVKLKQENPAPGQYESQPSPSKAMPSAAFRSGTRRQYEVEEEVMRAAHVQANSESETRDLEMTAKKKGVARKPMTKAGQARPVPTIGAGSIGNKVPGPGSYEASYLPKYGEGVKVDVICFMPMMGIVALTCSTQGDHMFANGITDRFGGVVEPRVQRHPPPGPGSYEAQQQLKGDKHLISSSYFMSNSLRGEFVAGDRPPGPGEYSKHRHSPLLLEPLGRALVA